jgi:uncharacterized protein
LAKLILIVCGVLLAWWLLKAYRRTLHRKNEPRPPATEDMVRCAHCGVHLPRSESRAVDGEFFCSEEHMNLHGSRMR